MPNKLSQFWQELKRRRVVHVIIVYATAAFVIIELVNNVYETLNLPDWTPAFTLIILVIGFPLALIFSWIFDITPEGIEKTQPVQEIRKYETESAQPVAMRNKYWGKVINWSLMGLLLIVTGTYILVRKSSTSETPQVQRYMLNLPEGEYFRTDNEGSVVTISPDGTKIVFASYAKDTSYLFLKRLDEFQAVLINGTEGAAAPFFSPDNTWVGFFADGDLKKVSILGGDPQIICEAKSGLQGCWGSDNTIIFSDSYKECLMSVSSNGGEPKQLTTAQRLSNKDMVWSHSCPQFLPGDQEILFTKNLGSGTTRIAAYSLNTGQTWDLGINGSSVRYVSTGHLIYAWKGDLFAVPFNLNSMETGEPVMVLKDVMSISDITHYSISEEGSLVYVSGNMLDPVRNLVLVEKDGTYESLEVSVTKSPKFSPDGNKVLYAVFEKDSYNMWMYGLVRGTNSRFSEKEYRAGWAIWSQDGRQIVYNSNMHGGEAVTLYSKKSDGTDSPKQLTISNYHQQPQCWSNDGTLLIFTEGMHQETGMDIYMLQMEGDSIPIPLLNSRFNETHPMISPDGQRLAYVSDQPGKEEVFVCTFPGLEEVEQISTGGGAEPLWAPDGKEIFYRDISANKLFSVSILEDVEFRVSTPKLVFEERFRSGGGPWGRDYDITPDGERFLMIKQEEIISDVTQINIVHKWTEELIKKVPTGK